MMWIRNTGGKPDAMLTLAVITFAVVLGSFIADGFGLARFQADHEFAMNLLETMVLAYFGRRGIDRVAQAYERRGAGKTE